MLVDGAPRASKTREAAGAASDRGPGEAGRRGGLPPEVVSENGRLIQVLPSFLLAGLALVNPMLRAVREQQYQRTAPWVVDHSRFARALGAHPTPKPTLRVVR